LAGSFSEGKNRLFLHLQSLWGLFYPNKPAKERLFDIMKKDIHPGYAEATIACACGNVITTRSTRKEMSVNTCSACHPYFTGQKTMIDTEGRVDRFMKRYSIKK
jgi:large subunit ribosomal protein L31